MKIKRIEIQGFKSFGEKQVLELNPRTNVIVGPNGSGKSNLIDAVNWVLGEQSPRSLRGERMEDIIFSGSSAKKPVGMAQVVLYVDNSQGDLPIDYNEIAISRRLFRSGESQYLINKIPCRLKDIRELFMGTGSGKGSLSIISQGQVDRILNEKPTYRREVFEEAAGISKYRLRCQEVKSQLPRLEEDIDILSRLAGDIENNMNFLRAEAEKAYRYLELRQKRNYVESLFLTKRAKKLFYEIAEYSWKETAISLWIDKISLQQRHFQELLSYPVRELKAKREGKDKALQEGIRLKLEKEHLSDRIHILQEKKSWLTGRKEECAAFLEKSSGDMEDLALKESTASKNCERLLEEIEGANREYALLKDNGEEINHRLDLAERKNKRISGTYVEVLNEQAKNSNLLSVAEKEISINRNDMEKNFARLKGLQENSQKLKDKIDSDRQTRNQLLEKLKKSKKNKESVVHSVKNLEGQLDDISRQLQESREKHSELSSKHSLLSDMHKRYEGYTYPVQELLNKGKVRELQGICGVAGDLLEVPEDFKVAIEVALGSKINNIVTDSTEAAKAAIGFLKKRKVGRLTFLPMDMLSRSERPEELKHMPGCLIAADIVTTDKKFKPVADYLLGRILVVESLDGALALAEKTKNRYAIVTVQGEIIHPGGAITGGSLKRNAGGIVGRRKTLEKLEAEIVKLEESISAVKREKTHLEMKIGEEKQKLCLVDENIGKVSAHIQELETEIRYSENQIDFLEREERVLRDEQDSLSREQEENAGRIAVLNRKKSLLERKISRIKKVADGREAAIRALKQDGEEWVKALRNVEVKLSALEQQYDYARQNIEQFKALRSDMWDRHQEMILDYKKCIGDIQQLDRDIEEVERCICSNGKQMSEIQQFQEALDEAVKNLEEKEKNHTRVLRKISSQTQRLERECTEYRRLMADLRIEIKGLDQAMEEDGGLGFIQITAGTPDIHSLREKSASLRIEMRDLEPVNLSSIQEYGKIEKEKAGLSKQVEDVKKACGHLREIIRFIEKGMERQFKEFFNHLQSTFNETYIRVFGGGNAGLLLQDEDVLEGNIDIMVQPPGKRTQSLTLLSGGERALTALTLLFAILQENRSPFCILDEVDTSLDENNIEHFTGLLKYYSEFTQFIVVSHRHGTMEAADNLFGVTMPEDGISTIVSVNLAREAG